MILDESIELKTFETLYALDSFRTYCAENERLMEEEAEASEKKYGPKWTPKTRDERAEFQMNLQNARHLQDKILIPTFRYSCVVMLCVILDRELLRLVVKLEKEHPGHTPKFREGRGSVLEPVARFCEGLQLRLKDFPEAGSICDLQKVRNCIVHYHGEISLSRDCDELERLNDKRVGFSAWKGTAIEIEHQCIEQFTREVWRFFIWVFHELKWKIDESWQEKKWPSCHAVPTD